MSMLKYSSVSSGMYSTSLRSILLRPRKWARELISGLLSRYSFRSTSYWNHAFFNVLVYLDKLRLFVDCD
jgi:hypothetical protein